MAILYDPHLVIRFNAKSVKESLGPLETAVDQNLGRSWNLGHYHLEEMEELLQEIADAVCEWVDGHPCHDGP